MFDVRQAESGDVAVVARLAVALWPGHTADELANELTEQLAGADAACFVAWRGDAAVGFAQCSLRRDYVEGATTSPVGYLEGIYAAPNERREGCASALLDACLRWARQQGCTEMGSDCALDNINSRRFHEAVGFAEAARLVCYIRPL